MTPKFTNQPQHFPAIGSVQAGGCKVSPEVWTAGLPGGVDRRSLRRCGPQVSPEVWTAGLSGGVDQLVSGQGVACFLGGAWPASWAWHTLRCSEAVWSGQGFLLLRSKECGPNPAK